MLLCAAVVMGCRAPLSDGALQRRYLRQPLRITQSRFAWGDDPAEIDVAALRATYSPGGRGARVSVRCPPDRVGQAQALTAALDASVQAVERELGLRLAFHLRFWLLPREDLGGGLFHSPGFADTLEAPLPTRQGPEADVASVVSDAADMIYVAVHELVEGHLVLPQHPPTALPDVRIGGRPVEARTRWFRDGLANYAGAFALRELAALGSSARGPSLTALPHPQPLRHLEARGGELLGWSQLEEAPAATELYAAALGLLLVVERRAPGTLRQVLAALPGVALPNGEALRALFRALGVDLAELIAGFRRPEAGLEVAHDSARRVLVVTAVRPGTPAATAGLAVGDELLRAGGAPLRFAVDLELALLDGEVELTVQRAGAELALRLAPGPLSVPQ